MKTVLRVVLSCVLVADMAGFVWAKEAEGAKAGGKPNVLIFLADDLGYGELGCQGNPEIPTPNIDALAKGGIRFTNGYVSGPYCSPTRAGLATGRYQTRFGHEFNSCANPGLPLTETTFAERMKKLGYATCAIGKWHLGSVPERYPMARGFDVFFGTVANTSYFNAPQFIDSRKSPVPGPITDPEFYTTDRYGEFASSWIREQKGPWFLYLPFNAQHAPLQATEKHLARVAGIAEGDRRIFAAMLVAMDDAVGKVTAAVREKGMEENTLMVFLSDNGGPTQSTTSKNGPLHGFKATTWEGGVRVPFLIKWKGVLPEGKTYDNPVIQLDLQPTALAAAGAKVDPAWKLDGVDLLPYLTGKNKGLPHQTLYWRFGEQWAIRHGTYKLVVARDRKTDGSSAIDPTPKLFNLTDDLGETKDLSAAQPEKAAELKKLWDAWNAELAPPNSPPEKNKAGAAGKGKGTGGKKKKKAAGQEV